MNYQQNNSGRWNGLHLKNPDDTYSYRTLLEHKPFLYFYFKGNVVFFIDKIILR